MSCCCCVSRCWRNRRRSRRKANRISRRSLLPAVPRGAAAVPANQRFGDARAGVSGGVAGAAGEGRKTFGCPGSPQRLARSSFRLDVPANRTCGLAPENPARGQIVIFQTETGVFYAAMADGLLVGADVAATGLPQGAAGGDEAFRRGEERAARPVHRAAGPAGAPEDQRRCGAPTGRSPSTPPARWTGTRTTPRRPSPR